MLLLLPAACCCLSLVSFSGICCRCGVACCWLLSFVCCCSVVAVLCYCWLICSRLVGLSLVANRVFMCLVVAGC